MNAILSKISSFLESLDGSALYFAIFVFFLMIIGLLVLSISGFVLISRGDAFRGVLRLLPTVAFLALVFLLTRGSWGSKEMFALEVMGLLAMSTFVQIGVRQIFKKETGHIIFGILFLLAAAALFIFVCIPIILEIIAFLKFLSAALIILLVVANIKIITIF